MCLRLQIKEHPFILNLASSQMEKIRVLVVDDHPMVLAGMQAMLAQISFVELVGAVSNAWEAFSSLPVSNPQIVITDISMPDVNGIELTGRIKQAYPAIRVIAMSTFRERSYLTQLLEQGASGYLVKSASMEEMEEAILTVYEGRLYVSKDVSTEPEARQSACPAVSRREQEVLNLIAEGLTNPQIAEQLFISLHTVDSHRKNLLTKFDVNNTASLIRLATKWGLV